MATANKTKKFQTPPTGKAKTQAERNAADESMWTDDESPYEIIRDGKAYRVGPKGNLIPVSGNEAKAAIIKPKKQKPKK